MATQYKSRPSITTLQLPKLRNDQASIVSHPAKLKVVAMGRRWGKTMMAGSLSLACASQGAAVAWVVPTYKNSRPVWRFAESMIAPISKIVSINKTEKLVEFPGGGWLGIYSADNDTAIRGESFDLVIIDEAAMIKEETYTDVIMPTLADRDGRCILISTPKGRNWFWKEFIAAQSDTTGDRKAWNAPSRANPSPKIQKAAELAKERVNEQTYRQEWLAEFLENEGTVFRRISDAVTEKKLEKPYPGRFFMGLDWAKQNDYTAIRVIDGSTGKEVDYDRFNQIDWHFQRERLKVMFSKWKPVAILAEWNSIGDPNIEALQREGLPVIPFKTTAITKPPLIESLALAFEKGEIKIINDSVLIGELEAFERIVSRVTGHSQYSAPEGMHDDTVIALALAWHAATSGKVFRAVVGGQRPAVQTYIPR